MPTKQEREETLFQQALNLTGTERAAFLTGACHGDGDLRQRLDTMLAAREQTDTSPLTQAQAARSTIKLGLPAVQDEGVGQALDRYKLLEMLGEGGCGVVYVAEQIAPVRRRVALKVIKLGMDTKAVVARFEGERQALAMMDHPNIAKVLDAGSTATGRPYFVMELVRGIKITDYCDQNNLSTKERLNLFIKVCQAIQHAHQKGIIHRDIKPSNILVTLHDGVPVPKVIDFGIAKATDGRLTDATVYTQLHQLIGTPAYMSPEQAEMSGLDIDTRSDIYSLGVLLYELLTGTTPFDAKELIAGGIDEMRKTIREKEPVRPSTRLTEELAAATVSQSKSTPGLAIPSEAEASADARRRQRLKEQIHRIKGDLDWIVMKCLEKDRTRRYESASGLAADLRRHLSHEPVNARPPSTAYRLQKAFRRNKLVYASAMAITAALLVALVVSGFSYLRERAARVSEQAQRQEAVKQRLAAEASAAGERQQRSKAESLAYSTDMNLILQALEMNNLGRGQELLNRNRPHDGQTDRRGWEWRYLWKRSRGDELATLGSHGHAVTTLAFSPREDLLASGAYDGKVKFWNWKDRSPAGELDLESQVNALAFSPDGAWLAVRSRGRGCRLWDVALKRESAELDIQSNDFYAAIAFSSQGDLLAMSAADSSIEIWDFHSRSRIARLVGHRSPARALVFSRDARTLYSAGGDDLTVRVWDVATRRESISLTGPAGWVSSVALSPDESILAYSSSDGIVRIWDLNLRRERLQLTNHVALVWDAKFSPDGRFLATSGADQRIRLWDTATWQEAQALQGHLNEVWCLAFSPDGKTLASGAKDETVKLWSADPKPTAATQRLFPLSTILPGGALSPDGRWFWAFNDGRMTLGDTRSLRDVRDFVPDRQLGNNATAILFDYTGQRLYVGCNDGRMRALDLNTGREAISLAGHEKVIVLLALSRDGQRLASAASGRTIRVQDVITGQSIAALTLTNDGLNCLSFSRDGTLLAGGSQRDDVLLWDLRTSAQLFRMAGHKGRISSLDFSPDGRRLASASWDGTAGLWDVATGQRLATLRAHLLGVNTVAFSPDGQRLAAGTGDGFIKLWNVTDGQEVLTLVDHHDINQVAFLPGDETLVSATSTSIRLWPAPTLKEITELERGAQRAP